MTIGREISRTALRLLKRREDLINARFQNPEVCGNCGHVVEAHKLEEEPYLVEIVPEYISGLPGDCYEAEYQVECPECGAIEPFETLTGEMT